MSEGIFGIRDGLPKARQIEIFKANSWVQVVRAGKEISHTECVRLLRSAHALHSIVDCTVEHMDSGDSVQFISSAARYFMNFIDKKRYKEPRCEKSVYAEMSGRFLSFMTLIMADKDAALEQGGCPAEHLCHSMYVGEYAESLSMAMGYDAVESRFFRIAGRLHDFGKVCGVPDRIVGKQGPLTDKEYLAVKSHAKIGADMLRKRGFGLIADIVLTVHKRYDCTGYPEDVEIDMTRPKNGILAVCDIWDVVSRGRPYQPGEGIEYAIEEIQRSSGTQLHPQVVGVALNSRCLEARFREIADEACLKYMRDVA